MNIGYSTELTIGQYQLLESLLPPPAATGRPRTVNMMLVIQGILYVLARVVAANVAERDGAKQLLSQVYSQPHRVRRLVRIWVDAGFCGAAFLQSIMGLFGLILDVVLRPQERQGFVLLPRRWVVERTYGWFHWCRRLNVDYERNPASSESLIYIAMIRLMLLRLA